MDYFELLHEPRRPWSDPEALKQKFLALSAEVHPDRVHQAGEQERNTAQSRYTEMNAAYQCLRDPRLRLRHLIELERGSKPEDLQRVPQDLMDAFMEVGKLCRDADAFLAERGRVSSPLLKAQMFERGQGWTDKLMALQRQLNVKRDELVAELRSIDTAWESTRQEGVRAATLARLEQLSRLFGFFERWASQVQERIVQLSF
jgi:DnaJ-domain-containing protein 1